MTRGRTSGVAVSLALLALLLLPLPAPVIGANTKTPGVSVVLSNNILTLRNAFVEIRFDLTAGASIIYYSIIDSPIFNCTNTTVPTGFHVASVRSDLGKPAENSSLLSLPWNADVLVNTSDKVVVRLTPSSNALVDISPARLYVTVVLTRSDVIPSFHIHLENPSNYTITLTSASLDGQQLGLELMFTACTNEPHTWLFYTAYSTPLGPVLHKTSNPNGTTISEFFPVNATFLGAANIRVVNNTPSMVELVESPQAVYYTAYKDATGTLTIKAYTNGIQLQPGDSLDIVARAGLSKADPALLAGLNAGTLVSLVNSARYAETLNDEANHYSIVKNLTTRISALEDELDNTKNQLAQCRKDKANLTSKIGELQELLDTCNVEKGILQNRLSELRSRLDSAGIRIAAIAVAALLLGVLGGYLIRGRR